MSKFIPNSWAIGLYSYSTSHPGAKNFYDFYDLVLAAFESAGITPTYFAAEGAGYRGNHSKYGGRIHNKALKAGFADIDVMSLVANPEGSQEPNYDKFASASLGYVKETGETLLCFALDERFIEFGGDVFESIFQSLIALRSWDFGYALSLPIEKMPEFHVLGLDGGGLNQEESRRLNSWYASLRAERLCKIRDVYPYVVLNPEQLAAKISEMQDLEGFARSEPQSTLTRLGATSLWLWKISPVAVTSIRDKLVDSGVLIT